MNIYEPDMVHHYLWIIFSAPCKSNIFESFEFLPGTTWDTAKWGEVPPGPGCLTFGDDLSLAIQKRLEDSDDFWRHLLEYVGMYVTKFMKAETTSS